MNSKSILCQPLFDQMFIQNTILLVLIHLSGYMGAVDNLYSPDLKLLLCAVAGKEHLLNEATCCFCGLKHFVVGIYLVVLL